MQKASYIKRARRTGLVELREKPRPSGRGGCQQLV